MIPKDRSRGTGRICSMLADMQPVWVGCRAEPGCPASWFHAASLLLSKAVLTACPATGDAGGKLDV